MKLEDDFTSSTSLRRPMREIQNMSELPSTSADSAIGTRIKQLSQDTKQPSKDDILLPDPHTMPEEIDVHLSHKKKSVVKKGKKFVTPAEQKLHKKLVQLRVKLTKCRSKVRKQALSLKAAKNITDNPQLLKCLDNLPSTAKLLTLLQLREAKKMDKGRRFTLQEKFLALTILKQSPKAYRFLRKIFILPAPQTLIKLFSQANLKPGINRSIFDQLKKSVEKMKDHEKLCILLFDEVSLKANLSYNERKDEITGFVTNGKKTTLEFADHAQVFMIRGLIKNYKQPVYYTFSAPATKGAELASQLKEVVKELQDVGFIVVATVCDQGSNNRNAIKLLLQETRGAYLRTGRELCENIIEIGGQPIFPLYDPPHLLKCIRNNLLTKDLKYFQGNEARIAKWDHLHLLLKENPGYKGIRLIPKLTDNHVIPANISKMKVKFAAQVFSRTVASNMGYLADKGILPLECKETADVLLFFDKLFDSFNGSFNKKSKIFGKPLLGPVKPHSVHHSLWTESIKKLKNMMFINKTTGVVESVPTLNNWVWTLEATQGLLKFLEKKYEITSIWMRHLNQDPIENFFGAVRSHGCRDTNPTPEKFESAFATLLINNMSSVHAPGANCEIDSCDLLHALVVTDNDCRTTATCQISNTEINIEPVEEKKKRLEIINPLQYVTGYFIRGAKKKIFKNCTTCNADLNSRDTLEYINYREYSGRRWLCSPSEELLKCLSAIQDISHELLKEGLHTQNTKELIKTFILIHVDFEFITCNDHKNELINDIINSSTRFFIFNYMKNINRILTGKRTCGDDSDGLELKAKKYCFKCFKRKNK